MGRRSIASSRCGDHATTDGLVGQVYNGDNRAHGPEIAYLVRDVLAPRVAGLSIMEGERIWERCFALTHTAGMSPWAIASP